MTKRNKKKKQNFVTVLKDSEYAPGVAKEKRQEISGLALKVAKRQIDVRSEEIFTGAIANSIKYHGLLRSSP